LPELFTFLSQTKGNDTLSTASPHTYLNTPCTGTHTQVSGPDGRADYYTAEIISSREYSAYGAELSGYSYTATEEYRYQFQNQEVDEEFWGGAASYKYRIEDPRLGRFFSVDPLAPKYPYYTPYQFSGNRVIDCVELEGLEPEWCGNEGDEACAPIQGKEDAGDQRWLYLNDDWERIEDFEVEVQELREKNYWITMIGHDEENNHEIVVAKFKNSFATFEIDLGDVPTISSPFYFDLTTALRADDDAYIVNLGLGATFGGGCGGSIQTVLINKGEFPGIYVYKSFDVMAGVAAGVGFQFGAIDYNESCGVPLNSLLFAGKSQSWSIGSGAASAQAVKAYVDGKWHFPGLNGDRPWTYEGELVGGSYSGDIEYGWNVTWTKTSPAFFSYPFNR
jgi:RHS repeat-associated protein